MNRETPKQNIGNIGEELASRFLVKHGFRVLERNYRKTFGEIDIICTKDEILHFVEVKTVSRRTFAEYEDDYRPEDNVHPLKLKRIGRAIQVYLLERDIDPEWNFDVMTVLLNSEDKTAKITVMEDLII